MLKKLIEYTDYNGNTRKENFYFNLNESELMDMELEVNGGMRQLLTLIMEKQDIPKIVNAFKTIILKSYGEKSLDGRLFNKSPELSDAFSHTEAYNVLYMELLSDAKKAAEFIAALLPESMRGRIEDAVDADGNPIMAPSKSTPEEDGNAHLMGVVK